MQVSVIIPAYNAGTHIKEAIDSALAQTVKPLEVLVVNNGSTDETAQIVKQYEQGGIVKLLSQSQRGIAAARNLAIKQAKGELIALLDADDRWLPTKLEKQLPLFSNQHVGLVYSDMRFFADKNGLHSATVRRGYKSGAVTADLIQENFISTSAVVIRKTLLEQSGLFSEDVNLAIGEDYHLWLRISLLCEINYVPEPLVEYRVHAHQTSADKKRNYECLSHLFALLLSDSRFAPYRSLVKRRSLESRFKRGYYGIFKS